MYTTSIRKQTLRLFCASGLQYNKFHSWDQVWNTTVGGQSYEVMRLLLYQPACVIPLDTSASCSAVQKRKGLVFLFTDCVARSFTSFDVLLFFALCNVRVELVLWWDINLCSAWRTLMSSCLPSLGVVKRHRGCDKCGLHSKNTPHFGWVDLDTVEAKVAYPNWLLWCLLPAAVLAFGPLSKSRFGQRTLTAVVVLKVANSHSAYKLCDETC